MLIRFATNNKQERTIEQAGMLIPSNRFDIPLLWSLQPLMPTISMPHEPPYVIHRLLITPAAKH